jgi:hypothetical protein
MNRPALLPRPPRVLVAAALAVPRADCVGSAVVAADVADFLKSAPGVSAAAHPLLTNVEVRTATGAGVFGNAVQCSMLLHLADAGAGDKIHHLFAIVLGRGVGLGQPKLFARGLFHFLFQKRVVVEHLVDLLAQLHGGELEQADRLLQLGRERQVLGDAK